MATCNHKYGPPYRDDSQSSGYARMCAFCGDVIEANEDDTCDHNWVATGNVGFSSGYGYVCTICGELGEELSVDTHEHKYIPDDPVLPDCENAGYTIYRCACGDSYVGDNKPALGHKWVAQRHDGFSSGYGYVCERCGELGDELTCTHEDAYEVDGSRVDPTCTEDGYVSYRCETCGETWQETLPKLGHEYGDPYYSNEFSSGYGQKCSRCGDLLEGTPPYTPPSSGGDSGSGDGGDSGSGGGDDSGSGGNTHTCSYDSSVVTSPTCTESGYTTYYCSCGASYVGDTEPALGHAYSAAFYSSEFTTGYGKKCSRCGNRVALTPPATEHTHSYTFSKKVLPTCTTEGYDLYVCSCGVSERRNPTPALGHTEGQWITDKQATCAGSGKRHQLCSTCGATIKNETIDPLGHKWSTPHYSAEFSTGYGKRCSRCGEIKSLSVADYSDVLLVKRSTLTAFADAVRAKTGGTHLMPLSDILNFIANDDSKVEAWECTLEDGSIVTKVVHVV